MKKAWFFCLGFSLCAAMRAGAGEEAVLRLPAIFGDNMVLQAEIAAPVWGWAAPAEKVTVTIAGQEKAAAADDQGRWQLKLDPLPPGGPHEMTVATAQSKIAIKNIMVGEVWLCSGQSNMQFGLGGAQNGAEEVQAAKYPAIRLFTVPNVA
ncbi:MAG: sialate O-acetylesterase, partial [Planctomycetota bacterium]|nr:sialate O-acetylesterase [Planctomycetota bacterium]